ncbi:MAG: PTS sugar transporter subunit IIA [Planctomycetota bacterium]|nr:PTS sugar transporter subunit IIA [Planctomycetota bacterium]
MADHDFDVESLAEYLHLSPSQVTRLVERGRIPARRVQGVWRFSPAEIHHWLENRIGLSDEAELMELEEVLRPAMMENEVEPTISEILPLDAIDINLPAKTRGSVITAMVELGSRTGYIWDPAKMIEAIRIREEMHTTALENGVALLHPRRPMQTILGEAFLAFGRTSRGIPFGGRRMTDLFFLICSLNDHGHLQTLARLSRLLHDEDLLSELRSAESAHAVLELLSSREAGLTGNE